MGKKFSGVSQTMSRFRGWIQAGATLLTNLHLPNFLKGGLYQGAGKTVCVPGLNCYSCPAASGACPIGAFQAVVGSSKFSFSYYITGFLILLVDVYKRQLHNIPEGMAVGVMYAGFLAGNTQITAASALALSLGIAIQNFPEGAIISMPVSYTHLFTLLLLCADYW